jgi:hypothetical protein
MPALRSHVPPESPSYIRLPTPPQSEEKKLPRVRGHLPVPREIFSREEGNRKVKPGYIQQTAPLPANRQAPQNETQRWKQTMASKRRKNLHVGLEALWKRRNRRDEVRNARVGKKFAEHNAAAAAPEREDDRLTRSTVLDAIMDTTVYPDPSRFEKAEESKLRVAAKERAKLEARRDSLMELYINASDFIVNENGLKEAIETEFADDFFKKQGQSMGRYGSAENTWDIWGKPASIQNMLEVTSGTSTKVIDYYESEYDRSVKRQKSIAEEFTGGKME